MSLAESLQVIAEQLGRRKLVFEFLLLDQLDILRLPSQEEFVSVIASADALVAFLELFDAVGIPQGVEGVLSVEVGWGYRADHECPAVADEGVL